MQLSIIPSLFAIFAIFATLVASAPVSTSKTNDLNKKSAFSGTATWYSPATQGGPSAACDGAHIDDNSKIVAMNQQQYTDENWCGKKIEITGPKGTVTATVLDLCPECKYGDLDLTPTLFKTIAPNLEQGVAGITWSIV